MAFYTERHGMRQPEIKTYHINVDMYKVLFDCCRKYFDCLAKKYPSDQTTPSGNIKINMQAFINALQFQIPTLFGVTSYASLGYIAYPQQHNENAAAEEFDQYALLDLIELISRDCRDYKTNDPASWEGHDVRKKFRKEINQCFDLLGLKYKLTAASKVERVLDGELVSKDVTNTIQQVKESGLRELLSEAIVLFRQPSPKTRKLAVEKIWDAYERLKSYYEHLNKKEFVEKIVKAIGGNQDEFVGILRDEFAILTRIGNEFMIRHYETNKIEISDVRHCDYFFNRCLSLIILALQYLEKEGIT